MAVPVWSKARTHSLGEKDGGDHPWRTEASKSQKAENQLSGCLQNLILLSWKVAQSFSSRNQINQLDCRLVSSKLLRMYQKWNVQTKCTHIRRMNLTFQCFYLANCDSHWQSWAKGIENRNHWLHFWARLCKTCCIAHFTNQNRIVFDAQLVVFFASFQSQSIR